MRCASKLESLIFCAAVMVVLAGLLAANTATGCDATGP